MNRQVYEAAKAMAEERGMTLCALVEAALFAAGVPVVEHDQQSREQVVGRECRNGREERIATRRHDTHPHRPSLERQMLGDGLANAMGFR